MRPTPPRAIVLLSMVSIGWIGAAAAQTGADAKSEPLTVPTGPTEAALQSRLEFPLGLAIDAAGKRLYVVERAADRVRCIDLAQGTIATVAGKGSRGFSGDGGPAREAELQAPNYVAVDPAGNLVVSDTFNHRLRRIEAGSGTISTIAGTGQAGFSGDAGPASAASLHSPYGVKFDAAGNLFFADTDNHRIRRIDAEKGTIATIAGDGRPEVLQRPHVLAVAANGDVIVGDSYNQRIRRLDARSGELTTLAGRGERGISAEGSPATEAAFGFFGELVFDRAGRPVFTEWINHRILAIDGEGKLRVIVGTGVPSSAPEVGPASEVAVTSPAGLVRDPAGNLYWVEADVDDRHGRVRRLDAKTGKVTTVAGKID